MAGEEKQELKAKLVELGFWGADEDGDPASDKKAADSLRDRLENMLVESAGIVLRGVTPNSSSRLVEVVSGEFVYPFLSGNDDCVAICNAALAFQAFLQQHPELAANRDDGHQ